MAAASAACARSSGARYAASDDAYGFMPERYQNGIISARDYLGFNTNLAVQPTVPEWHNADMGAGGNISTFRKKRGLTQAQLAHLLSVEQPTVQRWEKDTREPSIQKLKEIAGVLGVTVAELIDSENILPIGPRLFLKGEVAAGVWKEAVELPEEEWEVFHGRADVKAELQHRFGLRVIGDSMNELYPHGTIVECVSTFGHIEALPGRRVVIVRKRADGMSEATVKELALDESGHLWAIPKSTNPSFTPFRVSGDQDKDITETRVAAVVVGSYRPE
jgi:transcriptional regulator with XRE-family HTH domain